MGYVDGTMMDIGIGKFGVPFAPKRLLSYALRSPPQTPGTLQADLKCLSGLRTARRRESGGRLTGL